MDSPRKKTRRSPRKGNKLKLQSKCPKGIQTITSMFRKQTETTLNIGSGLTDSKKVDNLVSDEVEIVKVESQYFGTNDCQTTVKRTSSRLSLKRFSSRKLDAEQSFKSENSSSVAGKGEIEDTEATSSQKKNVGKTETLLTPSNCLKRSLKRQNTEDKKSVTGNKKLRHSQADLDPGLNTESQMVCDSDVDKDHLSTNTEPFLNKDVAAPEPLVNSEPVACSSTSLQNRKEQMNSENLVETLNLKNRMKSASKVIKTDTGNKKFSKPDKNSELSVSFYGDDDCNDDRDTFRPSLTKHSSGGSITDMDYDLGETEVTGYRIPYYLENFRTIITTVLEDDDNMTLFNEEDRISVSSFDSLSENAQKLYVRLFSRKLAWLPLTKIKYTEIGEDLEPFVIELRDGRFLLLETELSDLEKTLNIMSVGDLKSLAKTYHITGTNQNKKDIVQLLMKKSQQNTIGSMFKVSGLGEANTMLNRAKKLLGQCVHLLEEPRSVFIRMLMLFSLNDTVLDEESGSGTSNQLFQMLKVNIGKVIFPTYNVNKKTPIFQDRTAFLQFAEASSLESDILTKIEKKDFTGAYDVYTEARAKFEDKSKQPAIARFDKSLPDFLRSFTFCGVCVRVLNQGVELLQRRKDYTGAVNLLEDLLGQKVYCVYYRGHWWERLAINYDAHLKQPVKAMKVIKSALDDKYVRTGHRLALYQRAEKITSTPKSNLKGLMKGIDHEEVMETPKQVIEGLVLSDNIPGMRYRFIMEASGSEGEVTFCGVEQLVLDHYLMNGYTDGLHAEGSMLSNLFTMFFWDIIFCDVPDVFHSPYQSYPLDIHSDHFYSSRKNKIDERILDLRSRSEEDLVKIVAKVWENYHGTVCGIHWDAFSSMEQFQGLVVCFGGQAIAGIMERYAKMPRQTRGGFPDLTLWNTERKTVKISEVKGPGDRLSHKQILWIDYLIKLGLDAEVCHVKAVGTKRLKHT